MTETARTALSSALRDAQKQVTYVNLANGWFESDRTVGDDIALIHSEASEALEAFRDWGLEDQTLPRGFDGTEYKPEGFGSEMADILIRLLDTCERRGVDLAFEFDRKLRFNASRGHRHGGKRL